MRATSFGFRTGVLPGGNFTSEQEATCAPRAPGLRKVAWGQVGYQQLGKGFDEAQQNRNTGDQGSGWGFDARGRPCHQARTGDARDWGGSAVSRRVACRSFESSFSHRTWYVWAGPAPEGKHTGVPDILCLERCFSKDNKLFASGLGGFMECCPPGRDRPGFAAPQKRTARCTCPRSGLSPELEFVHNLQKIGVNRGGSGIQVMGAATSPRSFASSRSRTARA